MITVTVKLFAIYQDIYNQSELTLTFPDSVPVRSLLEQMIEEHPQLKQWQEVTRFGINLQFVDGETLIQDQDEIVLIPPVSGG